MIWITPPPGACCVFDWRCASTFLVSFHMIRHKLTYLTKPLARRTHTHAHAARLSSRQAAQEANTRLLQSVCPSRPLLSSVTLECDIIHRPKSILTSRNSQAHTQHTQSLTHSKTHSLTHALTLAGAAPTLAPKERGVNCCSED